MIYKPAYDLSQPFLDYLIRVASQPHPYLAYTADEMVDLIGLIEQEAFQPPIGLSIEQMLLKAIQFVNARLPADIRINYCQQGIFVSTLIYLDLPVFHG